MGLLVFLNMTFIEDGIARFWVTPLGYFPYTRAGDSSNFRFFFSYLYFSKREFMA